MSITHVFGTTVISPKILGQALSMLDSLDVADPSTLMPLIVTHNLPTTTTLVELRNMFTTNNVAIVAPDMEYCIMTYNDLLLLGTKSMALEYYKTNYRRFRQYTKKSHVTALICLRSGPTLSISGDIFC